MTRRLRVLLVTPDYPPPPGGIQTLVSNLEAGLRALGHEVQVLHVDPERPPLTLVDYLPRPRWLYSVRSTLTAQFRYHNALHRETTAAIEEFDPDVVHALHIRNWAGLVAARERGVPAVVSTHALELQEGRLARRAIRSCDAVHAVSEFTASLVTAVGGDDTPPVAVVPPSIDVDAFRDAGTEDNDRVGPVVTIARFVDRKNVDTLLDAWSRLGPSVREGRQLVVVGDGPNRRRLERIAADMPDVRFSGWVDEVEKRDLLADADLFALVPTRFDFDVEGFGIVYVEAQAAGTPVVGSGRGGAPEAIGEGGIVVDDEMDPEAVADAIETLLTDEKVQERCVHAIERRIDRFDVSTVATRHIEVYRSTLNK